MTDPLKFFKIDHTTIYHDGFSYSFHRILDPAKSSADQIQLRQLFRCALREEENCRSRCHVTGNWEMDKKGRKFVQGIVKKADHTHGQEYRDTTPKLRFYKNDDKSLYRNGFDYTFYRELYPPKQIADFQWHRTYRCAMSTNGQENCRARIYTTGQWEVNKRELQYQLGIFKNCFHSHESDQDVKEEAKENSGVKRTYILERIPASFTTRTQDLDEKEQIRFYKHKNTTVQHNGFVYSNPAKRKCHPFWRCRMYCKRKINGKHTCKGFIWTTGKWEEDDCGREFQIGIVMAQHDHEPFQMSMQGKDHNDDATEAGLKFYQYNDRNVHRDGFVYTIHKYLKTSPPWKNRMQCSRIGKNLSCAGSIWTTGVWEVDKYGRRYQRGIPRGGHSHKAYQQFLNEDDTAHIGNGRPTDDKQSVDENDDVVMVED